MASLVEAIPRGRIPEGERPPDPLSWAERIQPRIGIRNFLLLRHRETHEISESNFGFRRTYAGEVNRIIFSEADVGWPITDMLWGKKFFEAIPGDEQTRRLFIAVAFDRVSIQSGSGIIGLHMNTFPEVFGFHPLQANDPNLAHEAYIYTEQGPRSPDNGYETRQKINNCFDPHVTLNNKNAAEQILNVVKLMIDAGMISRV